MDSDFVRMTILTEMREELKSSANEFTRASGQRFFKEEIKSYGVKNPEVNKIGRRFYKQIKTRTKAEIFGLCEQLWKSGYMEECLIACHWSYFVHRSYETADFKIFEKWIDRYVTNWATCDTFCNHAVGTLIEMFPINLQLLKAFTTSSNRWKRRAAAVTLIVPARKGKFLADIFEIADLLLLDTDDLVRKGYGWMLKAASEVHQQEVFEYIFKHKAMMPRISLRYAIEKMPEDLKAKAMQR